MGITLFVLPIVSLFAFRRLLGNLFLLGPWNILWTMVATTTLAFSILVAFRVVLLNGKERFGIQQALTQDIVSHRALLLTESLTVPMLIATVFSNGQAQNALSLRLGAAIAGIVAVHVVGYGALWRTALLSPRFAQLLPTVPHVNMASGMCQVIAVRLRLVEGRAVGEECAVQQPENADLRFRSALGS